ncbi:response regulator [Lachnospiraceae bacterium WCA-9-b2]|uniref:Stage 0 sporulation protein A homolog n=1 Tax=Sporofaciens musculi TaxID=2681861 RepID=A0A7X3MGK1_9FIRM|nr:ATP-binding protein [Sporofaciens musculi]MXP75937.1 response regulator [Sporofaciens musculi]
MKKITLLMVVIILFISTVIQIFSMHQIGRENAWQIFEQVEQILDENSRELKLVQDEYNAMCLNDARVVAYILENNPKIKEDVEELRKIAANVEVDEIHIFDTEGVIVGGTHPEYLGYSFDSGEQIGFFKPLLKDCSLELVQEMTPNTAEGKLVQYSALWSEDKSFILQVGMKPSNVVRATEKNELSYIFSLLRTGVGYQLYAVDSDTKKVVGATVVSDVGKDIQEIGIQARQIESDKGFHAKTDGSFNYCLSKKIGDNYILWASPVSGFYHSIIVNEFLLLAGLVLISLILVYAVTDSMNRTVIDQIKRINDKLWSIQDGDLMTRVDVSDSKEFLELSTHINSMVESLLKSSEKLEMSEKIREQKEKLEKQHEQLEIAVKRAEAANKAKSEFLFNMSHDIRTPMNAILGFTNFALESNDPDMQREYLENIDVSSKQLLDLINNILELARIENHKIIVEEELVDVKETCRKLCTIFSSDLKKKNLTCRVNMDIRHKKLYVDTTHYSQVFLNIVSNAVKYTPDGGTIILSFRELLGDREDTCFVETVIEDNGIGMSEDFLAHAYESFSRERTSTVSGIQGTGLGLAIVKNLVKLMNGSITIESRQGIGTRVTIRLPHRFGEGLAEKTEGETSAWEHLRFDGRHILLAEDIDVNAIIATKLLSSKGFIVERAKDGVECVNMLLKAEDGYYDLVLMDIQMPVMDGYQAARAIRSFGDEKKAAVPILAMTANAFKEDREKAAEAGMDGHIAKPLDAANMFRRIAEVLIGRER